MLKNNADVRVNRKLNELQKRALWWWLSQVTFFLYAIWSLKFSSITSTTVYDDDVIDRSTVNRRAFKYGGYGSGKYIISDESHSERPISAGDSTVCQIPAMHILSVFISIAFLITCRFIQERFDNDVVIIRSTLSLFEQYAIQFSNISVENLVL